VSKGCQVQVCEVVIQNGEKLNGRTLGRQVNLRPKKVWLTSTTYVLVVPGAQITIDTEMHT